MSKEQCALCDYHLDVKCLKCGMTRLERACIGINEEIAAARREEAQKAERNFRWSYQLLIALAKRILKEANENRGAYHDWPAGQDWDDLVATSKSIFFRMAREEAGINHNEYLKPIRSGEYSVDDLFDQCPALKEGEKDGGEKEARSKE